MVELGAREEAIVKYIRFKARSQQRKDLAIKMQEVPSVGRNSNSHRHKHQVALAVV